MYLKRLLAFLILSCTGNLVLAATYYSISSTSPHLTSSWNSLPAGGGSAPSNFTTSGDIFIVQGTGGLSGAPHTMTTSSTWTLGANVTVEVQGGATLQANSNITFNATANFILDANANYNHNTTSGYASGILQGIENFDPASNFNILNSATTGPGTPANGGFGNLTLNYTIGSSVNCAGAMTDIKGNFTIIKTGGAALEFRLSGNTAVTLNIGGNLNIQGGILNFTNGTSTPTINLKGNFSMSGGDLRQTCTTNPSTVTLNFNNTGTSSFLKTGGVITSLTSNNRTIDFNVNSGDTLDMGTSILDNAASSTASFTLVSGAGLKMGRSDGISLAGAIGNVQVTGTRTFNSGATYEYNGIVSQVSGTGLPASVLGLIINNSAGMSLSNPATAVTGTLGLITGRIKTDITHGLTINTGAAVSSVSNIYGDVNEGTQTSFISGPLQIQINSAVSKTFPVGKDTVTGLFFAPAKIIPVNGTAKTYTVEYFPTSYNQANVDLGQLHHVSRVEAWDIQCSVSGSPNSDAAVGLSWRPFSELCIPGCTLADSTAAWADLVVSHYFNDGFSTKWHLEGVTPTYTMRPGSDLSYGYITTVLNSSSFSPFTLGSKTNLNLLPLKLLSFSGKHLPTYNLLQWNAAEERNIDSYQLQRSEDGINFNIVGTRYAYNSLLPVQYSFKDGNRLPGLSYYRLKLVDRSLKISYSQVIKLNPGTEGIAIYPNPAHDKITVLHTNNVQQKSISVYNANGMIMQSVIAAAGSGQTVIDISRLANGVYYLRYEDLENKILTQKIIKQ